MAERGGHFFRVFEVLGAIANEQTWLHRVLAGYYGA